MKDGDLFNNQFDKRRYVKPPEIVCTLPKSESLNDDSVVALCLPPDDLDSVYKDTVEKVVWRQDDNVVVGSTVDTELDPWKLPEIAEDDNKKPWKELSVKERITLVLCNYIGKFLLLLWLLFLFICSLDVLSSAFRLLGGRAAGEIFRDSELLKNPVAGLMIGVLATVLVQSSSTSTSIIVSMVASEILDVRTAIPIIMGANIGTSMTNTLVSVAHSTDRAEFRRAFAGATVHDMFNWLTVIVLLPLEVISGYLFYSTSAVVNAMNIHGNHSQPPQLLTVLTEPLTSRVIQLDKTKIEKIATGNLVNDGSSFTLIKRYCKVEIVEELIDNSTLLETLNETNAQAQTNDIAIVSLDMVDKEYCNHLFARTEMNDTVVGIILLIASLAMLIGCLLCIVKLLHSILQGHVASVIRKTVNADLPGCWSFLTGYVAILIGAVMTILVQSSSVFTSALTPLVGIGVLDVARMYPLTLGSNVGTTFTSVLAAMASPSRTLASALQISLCHLFFNLTGILLFYPIPYTRSLPINAAKFLGNKTAKYRWFALVYILFMFFMLPAIIFGLSMAGIIVLISVGIPVIAFFIIIALINFFQSKFPHRLPSAIRSWEHLPKWMHSLEPTDRVIRRSLDCFKRVCPFCASGWCCCRSPDTSSKSASLPPSESRRRLLFSSTNNSRAQSRAPSRASSPKVMKKQLLEIIEDTESYKTPL